MDVTDLFEAAADAVVSGDEAGLAALLTAHPDLVHARSQRPHRATLLTYIAANGVENERQRTPPNAVTIARLLLEAGADSNATARCYGGDWAILGLLVSSVHPYKAGLQAALTEVLLDHGAQMKDAAITALAFGYAETAETLVSRGAPVTLAVAAGLGRTGDVRRLLPGATPDSRHKALALAALHGRTHVVGLLLDAGEDPDRFNPDGFHAHSTPLHQAALAGHINTVRRLVERGARTDIRDTLWDGTALDWAEHDGRDAVAEYLRHIAPHS